MNIYAKSIKADINDSRLLDVIISLSNYGYYYLIKKLIGKSRPNWGVI